MTQKLKLETVNKLKLLREELRYISEMAGFLGDDEITLANADWSGTAAVLRPQIILHTENLASGSKSGLKQGTWFTVVDIPRSFALKISILDDLIGEQQGRNRAVDALTTLAQDASTLPDQQRNQVTKALGVVRRIMKL
jgi:hypothetical protein